MKQKRTAENKDFFNREQKLQSISVLAENVLSLKMLKQMQPPHRRSFKLQYITCLALGLDTVKLSDLVALATVTGAQQTSKNHCSKWRFLLYTVQALPLVIHTIKVIRSVPTAVQSGWVFSKVKLT